MRFLEHGLSYEADVVQGQKTGALPPSPPALGPSLHTMKPLLVPKRSAAYMPALLAHHLLMLRRLFLGPTRE